jgi:hypothetical protein
VELIRLLLDRRAWGVRSQQRSQSQFFCVDQISWATRRVLVHESPANEPSLASLKRAALTFEPGIRKLNGAIAVRMSIRIGVYSDLINIH